MTYSLKELTQDCGTVPKRTPVKGTLDSNVYRQVWDAMVKWIESQFLIRKARVAGVVHPMIPRGLYKTLNIIPLLT